MTVINSTLLVLLGWALGLLGAPIVERIQRRHRAREIKDGLRVELVELRFTMASCVHLFRQRLATLDHATLGWLIEIEASYSGPDKEPGMAPGLQAMLALTPGGLAAHLQAARKPAVGMSLKPYQASYLAAQVVNLGLFLPSLQQHLLQIKDNLDLWNVEVGFLMRQFDLTFDPSIGQGNLDVVRQNLESGYAKLATQAKIIADRVSQTLPLLE